MYLLPSCGAYLLYFLNLKLRTTRTGIPPLQFSAVAPSFAFNLALQFIANALFILVNVWSLLCPAVLLLPVLIKMYIVEKLFD